MEIFGENYLNPKNSLEKQSSTELYLKSFFHSGIQYQFKLAKRQSVISLMPKIIQLRIKGFFDLIIKDKIANNLFNDSKTTRCSNFRIIKLNRGAQKIISEKMLKEKLIIQVDLDSGSTSLIPEFKWVFDLLNITNTCFKEFDKNPSYINKQTHESVLTAILLKLDNALSVETPIWLKQQRRITDYMNLKEESFNFSYSKSITGHIDLLLYDEISCSLIIADYKPEGFFLRSLPQIAFYAFILKRILNIPDLNFRCLSFNREKAWIYKPRVLIDIHNEIKKYGNPNLIWRNFLKSI